MLEVERLSISEHIVFFLQKLLQALVVARWNLHGKILSLNLRLDMNPNL